MTDELTKLREAIANPEAHLGAVENCLMIHIEKIEAENAKLRHALEEKEKES
jgi:hypothetical protein